MNSRTAQLQGVRIAGTGSYLPGPALDRDAVRDLLRGVPDGLEPEMQDRLLQESGIESRHYAIDFDGARRETNTTMAAEAGRRALAAAGWDPQDVDLLVVTTVVPDQLMPPTSTLVQEALGIRSCAEIEISANCTAPTKGLMFASAELQIGRYRRALVCSSQLASFSFFPPWTNPAAMRADQGHLRWVLSDGAGAIALEVGDPDIELRVHLESCGHDKSPGMSLALGTANPDIQSVFASGLQHVTQKPMRALKEGMRLALAGVEKMLRAFELPGASIDHFIPSISSVQVARRLQTSFGAVGIRPEAWRTNFTRVGYVGSVAVPIMLDELARVEALAPGDVVCTVAEESSKWMFAGTAFRWNPART